MLMKSSKIRLLILLVFVSLNLNCIAQSIRAGLHFGGGLSYAKTDVDKLVVLMTNQEQTIKGRINGMMHLGLSTEWKVTSLLRLEVQPQLRFGHWNFISKDKTTKGTYSMSFIELPFHALFTKSSSEYSYHEFIGFGPSVRYSLAGRQKLKMKGNLLQKENLNFNDTYYPIGLGLDLFIGMEDSEGTSLRVGLNADLNGLKRKRYSMNLPQTGTWQNIMQQHGVFVQLVKYL